MDLETLPGTAKEALALGQKHYFTGKACPHGHVSTRRAANNACDVCARTVHYSTESARESLYRSKYGLERKDINALLKVQDYQCAICQRELNEHGKDYHSRSNEASVVDHDHETGKVRGILCQQCNKGLGQFKDSVELLRNAISYLQNDYPEGVLQ